MANAIPLNVKTLNIFSPIDKLVDQLINVLAYGKSFTIFSFLFGISFYIQMEQASKLGRSFVGYMTWRLFILFCLGFLHSLFYVGDVLGLYSVLGLVLLLFRRLNSKALLGLGFFFALNIPGLISKINGVINPPSSEQLAATKAFLSDYMKQAEIEYYIKQGGTLMELLTLNVKSGLFHAFFGQFVSGRMSVTFGMFILGLWAGGRQLFIDTPQSRSFLKRVIIISGVLAAISTAIWGSYTNWSSAWQPLSGWLEVQVFQAYYLQWFTLSIVYGAGLTLLFWEKKARVLHWFIAVGRMGLTTYVFSSIIGAIIYMGFGFGQLGHMGFAASVLLGLIFFLMFSVFANWWFKKYQYGPIEWLWRSLTYRKTQPFRKKAIEVSAT